MAENSHFLQKHRENCLYMDQWHSERRENGFQRRSRIARFQISGGGGLSLMSAELA